MLVKVLIIGGLELHRELKARAAVERLLGLDYLLREVRRVSERGRRLMSLRLVLGDELWLRHVNHPHVQ